MDVLGFDFDLPDGMSVRRTASTAGSWCIEITGQGLEPLSALIADKARAAGFVERRRGAERTELERGEQRIVVVLYETGLLVQIYDPSVFPAAQYEGSVVVLGDLRVDTEATSVVPLRERLSNDGRMRSGTWRLATVSAADTVDRVIAQAVETRGLVRGAAFGPPKGGRQVWSGEAHSELELIKARATSEPNWVLLEIDFVDNRP